ncbi:hypothetical protein K474DRAFT_1703945 [Panus rudis PR-1116 ss-1]|nr:hypothetical protein K474DRAFT_1703945 [Panus rudis PR-1116 ss-1]
MAEILSTVQSLASVLPTLTDPNELVQIRQAILNLLIRVEDQEESPDRLQLQDSTPPVSEEDCIEQRVNDAIDHKADSVAPETVVANMIARLRPERRWSKQASEDQALKLVLTKYQDANDWHQSLGPLAAQRPSTEQIKNKSQIIELVVDTFDRITQRREHIQTVLSAQMGHNLLLHFYAIIEDIKFCVDWSSQPEHTRLQCKKIWFVRQEYPLEDEEHAILRINSSLAVKFDRWQSVFARVHSGRARLWHAYNHFGAPVFLDQFWNSTNLSDTRRTKQFVPIVATIAQRITHPSADRPSRRDLHQIALPVVLSLTNALGANVPFMQHFFDSHSPTALN